MQTATRIVIIEDDRILLQIYKQLLAEEQDFVIVNGYSSFEQAEKHLVHENPGVILLDIQLPGINGIEAIPAIRKLLPKSRILMLTVYESEQHIFQALANGASGYITKDSPSSKIIDAIKEVREGGVQ